MVKKYISVNKNKNVKLMNVQFHSGENHLKTKLNNE